MAAKVALLLALTATNAGAQPVHVVVSGGHAYAKLGAVLTATAHGISQQADRLAFLAADVAARNACGDAGLVYLPAHAQANAQGCVDPSIWANRCTTPHQTKGGGRCITTGPGALILDDTPFNGDWYSATAYCAASTAGGFSDWRLPSVSELFTNYSAAPYFQNGTGPFSFYAFPTVTGSNETLIDFPNRVYAVYRDGSTLSTFQMNIFKTSTHAYHCVRRHW